MTSVSLPRSRSLLHEIVINVGFAGIRAILLIAVVRYAGFYMTPVALGLFLLARRIWTTVAGLVQAGMSQTLIRSISLHFDNRERQRAYLAWVVVSSSAYLLIVPAAAWLLRGPLGVLMFGARGLDTLSYWTVVAAVVTATSFSPAAFLLAQRKLYFSNILQAFGVGGATFIALVFWRGQMTPDILARDTAAILGVASFVAIVFLVIDLRIWRPLSRGEFRTAGRDFASYGTPRAISASIETFGALIAPWLLRANPAEAAYFLIALTILSAVQLIVGPSTQILAISVARSLGKEDDSQIASSIRLLTGVAFTFGLIVTAVMLPWMPAILKLWLVRADLATGAAFYCSWVIFAVTPVMLFYLLRNLIEVRWVFPCNLVTQVIAILGLCVAFWVSMALGYSRPASVAAAMLVMLFLQGAMSAFWVRAELPSMRYLGMVQLVCLVAILSGINWWAADQADYFKGIIAFVANLLVIYIVYSRFRPQFISEVMEKIYNRLSRIKPQAQSSS